MYGTILFLNKVKIMVKFSELGIDKNIAEAIEEDGIVEAFPIQESAIPHILHGEDVIGQAHTGTGKTYAFALPLIQKIEKYPVELSALIIVPTRELAFQVTEEIHKAAMNTNVKVIPIYGGVSIERQISWLRLNQQIIVATPGRFLDLYRKGVIDVNTVKHIVLDEADKMFDMGFKKDMEIILEMVPKNRQTLMFSATMPEDIIRITEKHMKHPVKILIDMDELSAELIDQTYLVVDRRRKLEHLEEILKTIRGKVLIFCATKHRTSRLSRELYMRGFKTSDIHGGHSQSQREGAIRRFKEGVSQILVATDIAARGIDIPQVEHVINFDVPMDPLMYFHRIGRTARAGESGKALTLVSQEEYDDFQNILKHTEVFIKQLNEQMGIKVEPFEKHERIWQNRGGKPRKSFGSRPFGRRPRWKVRGDKKP